MDEPTGDGADDDAPGPIDAPPMIAPLFADAPGKIEASKIKRITLRRRTPEGPAEDVIMRAVIDPATRLPFVYDPYRHSKDDIGMLFGPGKYIVCAFNALNHYVGAHYEFSITPDVVSNTRARSRAPSAARVGFNVPLEEGDDEGGGGDDPAGGEVEPQESPDARYTIDEVLGARERLGSSGGNDDLNKMLVREVLKNRSGGGGDKGAIDLALKLYQTVSEVREGAGIETPTAQNTIASLNAQHEVVVQGFKDQIEDLRKAAKKAGDKHDADLEEAKGERKKLIEAHEAAIKKLVEKHDEAIDELKKKTTKAYDEESSRLKDLAKEDRQRLQSEIAEKNEQIKDMRKEHREALEEARKDKSGVVGEKDEEKKRIRQEADRDIKKALDEAEAETKKRREDIRTIEKSFEEKIAGLERDLASARKENIKLTKDLAERGDDDDDDDSGFPRKTPKIIKQWAPPLMKAGADFLQNSAKDAEREKRDRDRQEADLRRARQETERANARAAELEAALRTQQAQPAPVAPAAPAAAPVAVSPAVQAQPAPAAPAADPPRIAPAPADSRDVPPPASPTAAEATAGLDAGTTVAQSGGADFAD